MRLFFFSLLFVLALEQYHLWWGKNGVQDHNQLQEMVTLAQASNNTLILRNNMMFSEIDDLKRGSEAVEERARNELGLVKEGETFFRIVPKE
ncbi:cell division protein FtsB [Psychromonas sp. Urea-02u-13]|uniref:cell division protein FtsB n=1 Tax=Psychromonas sp. Urea-02u-13 TaxID=2058326 RepID=UPI000C32033F|nr:cell division protein FtsB [Psychromonas sp. Urea-02u-13]PKG38149.1 cell division protein FtsB [Psychromonas sp. Urea-02u-13]